jgi:hypothetical protein
MSRADRKLRRSREKRERKMLQTVAGGRLNPNVEVPASGFGSLRPARSAWRDTFNAVAYLVDQVKVRASVLDQNAYRAVANNMPIETAMKAEELALLQADELDEFLSQMTHTCDQMFAAWAVFHSELHKLVAAQRISEGRDTSKAQIKPQLDEGLGTDQPLSQFVADVTPALPTNEGDQPHGDQ